MLIITINIKFITNENSQNNKCVYHSCVLYYHFFLIGFLLYTTKHSSQVLYQINTLLLERKLMTPNQRILIAVSGGQDSICVLNILYQLNSCWNWKLGIVYCDHKWHDNSQIQGLHISELATHMSINYYQVVSTQTISSETLARNWRYTSIKRIAICHDYSIIVTGHSATDRIETLIYNLIRGSGTIGLQSLSWKRKLNSDSTVFIQVGETRIHFCSKNIFCDEHSKQMTTKKNQQNTLLLIRPLLNITRTELTQHVQKWQLSTWPDPTNQNFKIRRNRIRHQLLPYLRHFFNPNVDRILANWTEMVHAETMYFENLVNCIRDKASTEVLSKDRILIYKKKNFFKLNVQILLSLPIAIQRRILKKCLSIQLHKTFQFEYLEQIRLSYSLTKHK